MVTVTMLSEIISCNLAIHCNMTLRNDSPLLSLFLLICSGVVIVVVASPGPPLSPPSSSQSPLTATAQFSNFLADAAEGDPAPRGEGADAH